MRSVKVRLPTCRESLAKRLPLWIQPRHYPPCHIERPRSRHVDHVLKPTRQVLDDARKRDWRRWEVP